MMHLLLLAVLSSSASTETGPTLCSSAKEYVAVFEYLHSNKDLKVDGEQARLLAEMASQSCTGSARRMIGITELLTRSGLGAGDSLKIAKRYLSLSDEKAEAFQKVFIFCYAKDGLDLDLLRSISIAQDLAADFEGDSEIATRDFEQITKDCQDEIKGSIDHCSQYAKRISRLSKRFSESVAHPFLEALKFLHRSSRGPTLELNKALALAESIIESGGAQAFENYEGAFRYARSESGLSFPNQKAMEFALKMAKRTIDPQSLKE